jgi:predicted metalloprotease with PDZ domain
MLARVTALLSLLIGVAPADAAVEYAIRYAADSPGTVRISLKLEPAVNGPVPLIMPRTYPGGYAQIPYDDFVSQVHAQGADGRSLDLTRDPDGPRWVLGHAGDAVASIDYVIDVVRMERRLPDAVSTSKLRDGYLGLLGYSVFAYVEGCTEDKIRLRIEGPAGWPVVSTLHPQLPAPTGKVDVVAVDYYDLADSQILMGPKLALARLQGAIGLYMAIYAEGAVDTALEGRLAREALDRVQAYFGDTSIHDYTVQLELLQPLPGHSYGFSQEHIASGTFSLSVDAALTAGSPAEDRERVEFNFAHHMAHSWIPKRAHGEGYRPFNWEMEPVIDTIWFNEGFGRYAAIAAMAAGLPAEQGRAFRESQLARLRGIVDTAPSFIRRMPLTALSREASFLYSSDFRTGRNVFARGALMAAEMDDRIQAQSCGKKSLRDALRWLLGWSAEHRMPFATEDLAGDFAAATGVPVADILDHWQRALEAR